MTCQGARNAALDTGAARIREWLLPLFDHVAPMPYAHVELQHLLDEANAWRLSCYEKALYLDELHDDVITVLTRHASGDSWPLSRAMIIPLDGAYQDVVDHDTAWGGSRAGYGIVIIGLATTPEQLDTERAWVRSLWEALMPYASGIGAYVNTLAQFEDDRARASYGPAKYERLARIKVVYDPGNVFHRNVNIKPASPSASR
ncbi:MAG: BBE domain-containing protein [Pseudonocardiales bacterium]|nr:BBE domain-containing protein [Pseudonocardiales bacterium]